MEYLVQGQDVLFNLAGQVSHIDSMTDPFTDLEINCRSAAVDPRGRAEAETRAEDRATRGPARSTAGPATCPWTKTHPLAPADVNGINKISGEFYHLVYNQVYNIRASLAAPHQHLRSPPAHPPQPPGLHRLVHAQAVARRDDRDLRRRAQRRDFNHVDDVVDAFLARGGERSHRRAGLQPRRRSPISLLDLVELLVEVSGSESYTVVPFPRGAQEIDIGDFYADAREDPAGARLEVDHWPCARASTRTIDYYRSTQDRYL